MTDRIFCGKAKEINGQYGAFYRVNLCLTDIPEEYVTTLNNGKRYVNLQMAMMKATDDKGNTHTVTVDTYRKEQSQQPSQSPPNQARATTSKPKQQPSRSPQRYEQNDFPGPEDFDDVSDIPF